MRARQATGLRRDWRRSIGNFVSEELLINVCLREVRAAILESGVLQELFIEQAGARSRVGNIYKGRVIRVLPGLQAAFVNVGLERSAFLHKADVVRGSGPDSDDDDRDADIGERLTEGDERLVQVFKDPLGSKGARLTTRLTLPSRLLVYTPDSSGVAVSARIGDDAERERLRALVEELMAADDRGGYGDCGGYIVRTAAQGASRASLAADRQFLCELWRTVRDNADRVGAAERVYRDLPLAMRMLRDRRNTGLARIRVDSAAMYDRMKRFTDRFVPDMSAVLELHDDRCPLFARHGIEDAVARALERRVPLKSGGYLMIDQTEALTAIDVNTGRYVGHPGEEDIGLRTNLEAAAAIARQLRLRNLGGIIVVDFIDMADAEHRRQLVDALTGFLAADRGRTHVMNVSPLGLVEMSRRRTRDSLERILCRPCPTCEGRGITRTPATVCSEIFREILSRRAQADFGEVLVTAAPEVIDRLLAEDADAVARLERLAGASIRLQSERLHRPERFHVIPM